MEATRLFCLLVPALLASACAQDGATNNNHLLLVGGFDGSLSLSDVEVISLSPSSDYSDAKPSAIPWAVHGSPVAAVFESSVVVCGGMTDSGAANDCFFFHIDSNIWVGGPSMLEGREFAAACVNNGTWWITGGWNGVPLQSTELLSLSSGTKFTPGPDLPLAMDGHCLTRVNIYTLMLTWHDMAWIMDVTTQVWREVQGPTQFRLHHSCATVYTDSDTEVVLVGGLAFPTSVEIFSMSSKTWRSGQDLPRGAVYATAAYLVQDAFVVVGGLKTDDVTAVAYNDILRFDATTEEWTSMEQTLVTGRAEHAVVAFSDGADKNRSAFSMTVMAGLILSLGFGYLILA